MPNLVIAESSIRANRVTFKINAASSVTIQRVDVICSFLAASNDSRRPGSQ